MFSLSRPQQRPVNSRRLLGWPIHLGQLFFFFQSDWFAISDNDVIFTVLGGEYKAGPNCCRELGVLPNFHSKNVLKIREYPSVADFEGKKRRDDV